MKRLYALAFLALLFVAPSSFAGPDPELDMDFDSDGVINRFDNCYLYSNPSQFDADGDAFGNACDPDLNNDGYVDFRDLSLFSDAMFTDNANADFNEDGVVNFLDFEVFRRGFNNGRPGPGLIMHWVGESGLWNEPTNWSPPQVPSYFFSYAVINTPESVVVTVPSDLLASAKQLDLSGTLVVCGHLDIRNPAIVTGTLSTDCDDGDIFFARGIDLGGEIILNSGRLQTPAVRKMDGTSPRISVKDFAEIEGYNPPTDFTTDVDIYIEPDAWLSTFIDNIVLNDASIILRSEEELSAVLSIGGTVGLSGSGTLKFEGPDSDTALGTVLSLGGLLEIGSGIEVQIEPQTNAYFRTRVANDGKIVVANGSTLFFEKFGVMTNTGEISCHTSGRLLEFEIGAPFPGDSVLINQENASVLVDDCSTTWPTRIVNQGSYEVVNSELTMPLIGSIGEPLDITNSDITIQGLRLTIPDEFYVFDPANENTVLMNGLLYLDNETLTIDAAKWRFSESEPVRFEFGTIESETPLNLNSSSHVTLLFAEVNTSITLEPASELILGQGARLIRNVSFLEPENCSGDSLNPAVLRVASNLPATIEGTVEVNATSFSDSGCLSTEIVTHFNNTLPDYLTTTVNNAALKIYAEGARSFELLGSTSVSGANAELTLHKVINSGPLECSDGATLNASGTAEKPFTNQQLISGNNCTMSLTDYWLNNGNINTLAGSINLSGPEGGTFTPGTGVFVSSLTSYYFDFDISDTSQLDAFKLIPQGGLFTFQGTLSNVGPELNVNDFPFNTVFADGFELADTRVVGSQEFRLSGSTTLRNVELAVNTAVTNNGTLNVFDQLHLDDATLTILSNSEGGETTTTSVLLHGVPNVSGNGTVSLLASGQNALSELVQTVDNMSLSFDSGINIGGCGGGECLVKAGPGAGELNFFGDVFAVDAQTRFRLESDATVYNSAHLFDGGQIRVADGSNLAFSGASAGLSIELDEGTMEPGIVAEGTATIDVSEASLSFLPGEGYELESDKIVTVLSHEGDAQRIGEFNDITGAQIEGQLFTPDYSSPDVTIFTGPTLGEAPLER